MCMRYARRSTSSIKTHHPSLVADAVLRHYQDGLGFAYLGIKILVELQSDDSLQGASQSQHPT